jgi:hypothetical protein
MIGAKVTDKDNGYRELTQNVRKWRNKTIRIGVNDDVHAGRSGLTNAQLGAIHEFGLGKVPERSFLRAWVDQQQGEWMAWLRNGVLASLLSNRQWASNFGKYAVKQVQARIRAGIAPALDNETIKRKPSHNSTPLMDTEQLFNAIEYDVDGGGK